GRLIAGDGGAVLDTARPGDDTVARSPESVQHGRQGEMVRGQVCGDTLSPARGRDRSAIRVGTRLSRFQLRQYRRVGACSPVRDESVATAGACQRSGTVLYRLYL